MALIVAYSYRFSLQRLRLEALGSPPLFGTVRETKVMVLLAAVFPLTPLLMAMLTVISSCTGDELCDTSLFVFVVS